MISTVLFTGGSGLLAVNWAVAIRNQYKVVLGLHEREISIAGGSTRKISLESIDDVGVAIGYVRPSMIVHTTGLTSVEKCETDPDLALHVNVDLAVNVAAACALADLPLVHISTDHLFSGDVPFVEETCPTAPLNIYGRTKAEAETRVLETNPRALVIRTNFYGWGPSYRKSFSDIIIKGLREGRDLTLFEDVNYTPILIEAAIKTVHELVDVGASGIFHVVGDERLSKYEFGLKVAEEFGLDRNKLKPGLLSDQTSLVRRPTDMSLSNQKTCEFLGRGSGGIEEHLARLRQQEESGLSSEIQAL